MASPNCEGQQIASYIRSLPVPSPGRPWNPPYQPGPGLDRQPVENWAAGAGLAWALDNDSGTLPFIFGANPQLDGSALVPRITREPFRPDGNLNVREIPISLQLPDWNHWLPQVHPMDAWGPAFEKNEFSEWYGWPLCGTCWPHRIFPHRFRPAASSPLSISGVTRGVPS